jgi:hypothetical protein
MKPSWPIFLALWAAFCGWAAFPARANVYATHIFVNGSPTHAVLAPTNKVAITYILNEPATAGVTVQILSGTNVIKTFSDAGSQRGTNTVVWDGSMDSGTNLPDGIYNIAITAAALGYSAWTNITDDSTNYYVNTPRGIAVNQNASSPYYGRVFVANANDPYGIYKYHADGSPADGTGFSTGGQSWGATVHYSPWKIAISQDDFVYIDDFSQDGVVYQFDQMISSQSFQVALGISNYPTNHPNPQLSGLAVTGSGANTQIWMTDAAADSAGVIVWNAATNGLADPADTGMIAADVDPTNALSERPWDIDLDPDGNMYVIQLISRSDPPADALICFPPYANYPETNTLWTAGYDDPTMRNAHGVAVDPTGSCVAVAVVGTGDPEGTNTGFLNLYDAFSGGFITNLDQTGGDAYFDVAWDAVGNVYALDGTRQRWRVYSPPGANQATTTAVGFIQTYSVLTPPLLQSPTLTGTNLCFTLVGQSSVTYQIRQSMDLSNWTNVQLSDSTNAIRTVCVPATKLDRNFYQAVSVP